MLNHGVHRCSLLTIYCALCVVLIPLPAMSYVMAPTHGYLVEVGVQHTAEEWSSGIDYDSSGLHLLLGHGLHERCTVYWEVFAENPVINNGVVNPEDPEHKTDVSPNTYIFGAGVGIRGILFSRALWSVQAEARYTSLSEFDDFVEWSNGVYTDIHVDEISTLGSSVLVVRTFGPLDALVGVNVSSTFSHGEIKTMVASQPDRFRELDERDKIAVKGILGFDFSVGEKWSLLVYGEAGDGYGGKIGFNRQFK